MERRGDTNLIMNNIIYLLLFILFFMVMFWFVNSYSNGSAFYEDFYSKEIVSIVNKAEPGMEFKIDVSRVAGIAFKNGKPLKDIVSVDNVNNRITVSSRLNAGTSFNFFNDVDIVEWSVEVPSGKPESTRFIFKVKDRGRNE